MLARRGTVHRFWNESDVAVRFCEIKFTLMGGGLTQEAKMYGYVTGSSCDLATRDLF